MLILRELKWWERVWMWVSPAYRRRYEERMYEGLRRAVEDPGIPVAFPEE